MKVNFPFPLAHFSPRVLSSHISAKSDPKATCVCVCVCACVCVCVCVHACECVCVFACVYHVTLAHLTDDIHCDLLQVLFYVHCCLSISLRPDPIQQLITTLIEGGKKSLQIAIVTCRSARLNHVLRKTNMFC